MNHSHFDFAQARQNMVENQLRPAEVNHTQIIEIMRAIPREECVDVSQREMAYADINLPLSNNRFLSEPRVVARLMQLADIRPSEKVLIVGASTGYMSTIADLLEAEVFAIEEDEKLSLQGQAFCKKYAKNVQWQTGKLSEGFNTQKPFDIIIIDGAITDIPSDLIDQLALNGRIITIMKKEQQVSHAVKIEKTTDGISIRSCFYAGLPLLQELQN
ncbi:protein-L-isoaspartate O-methyltransferase [Commensalibacter papalotli (ex Botero et al. 2024)]|uniref:Protein-L-isoaspartate O-methyltransferase n=1 Tax=Commensalibacter papalotli (ex Botero et al. 2024) TaxID=2972766 RepID=A0ABM9HI29_9PROT|nr:protein-L-isoaspartate O-methyltransferase [Commensalibacter papalotli (ex Botero et al. 2024)]CAI3923591.1 Protein-L-isoaspartate O-methyltransferase (Pcm) (PDB:3LBF) (PUBMED:24909784) [Commensalibacter papalotli (ex Botero et al. 2024)]CAI3928523.1 Protein-L-isoaspartate O-methyltransferase (Pcm) (PDB:3LBF) (PUBMED:24909784) [Commensalibacter papalotli (ex Botero et al. 2024)]